MQYGYEREYYALFRRAGQGQERFDLSDRIEQMLGFLLLNPIEIDELIDSLIVDAYNSEFHEASPDICIEKMLTRLKNDPRSCYFGQNRSQIISCIIEDVVIEQAKLVESKIQSDKGRKALRRMMSRTNINEKNITSNKE